MAKVAKCALSAALALVSTSTAGVHGAAAPESAIDTAAMRLERELERRFDVLRGSLPGEPEPERFQRLQEEAEEMDRFKERYGYVVDKQASSSRETQGFMLDKQEQMMSRQSRKASDASRFAAAEAHVRTRFMQMQSDQQRKAEEWSKLYGGPLDGKPGLGAEGGLGNAVMGGRSLGSDVGLRHNADALTSLGSQGQLATIGPMGALGSVALSKIQMTLPELEAENLKYRFLTDFKALKAEYDMIDSNVGGDCCSLDDEELFLQRGDILRTLRSGAGRGAVGLTAPGSVDCFVADRDNLFRFFAGAQGGTRTGTKRDLFQAGMEGCESRVGGAASSSGAFPTSSRLFAPLSGSRRGAKRRDDATLEKRRQTRQSCDRPEAHSD